MVQNIFKMNIIENILQTKLDKDISQKIMYNLWKFRFDETLKQIDKISSFTYDDDTDTYRHEINIVNIDKNYKKIYDYYECICDHLSDYYEDSNDYYYSTTYYQDLDENADGVPDTYLEIYSYNFYDKRDIVSGFFDVRHNYKRYYIDIWNIDIDEIKKFVDMFKYYMSYKKILKSGIDIPDEKKNECENLLRELCTQYDGEIEDIDKPITVSLMEDYKERPIIFFMIDMPCIFLLVFTIFLIINFIFGLFNDIFIIKNNILINNFNIKTT